VSNTCLIEVSAWGLDI